MKGVFIRGAHLFPAHFQRYPYERYTLSICETFVNKESHSEGQETPETGNERSIKTWNYSVVSDAGVDPPSGLGNRGTINLHQDTEGVSLKLSQSEGGMSEIGLTLTTLLVYLFMIRSRIIASLTTLFLCESDSSK